MAIIYSYPSGGTALGADQLLITRIVNLEPRNYNLTIDAISAYTINSLTSGGTTNFLPKFGGAGLVDSFVSQDNQGLVFIGTQASGTRFTNTSISTEFLLGTSLFVTNINSSNGGTVNIQGNAIIGNEATDTLTVNSVSTFNADLIVYNKIGIRIANPQRELDVDGGVRIRHTLDLFQGNDNTFAGTDAGNLFNIVASSNTGFGKNSQAVNISGSSNTSMGLASLGALVTGNNNTAIGTSSLSLSNGGSFNTALGSGSLNNATLGQGNTAIGYNALENKTTTNFNTAVGNNSLGNITSGFRNTAVGNDAGKFTSDGTTANATGNNSVFIGDSAKAQANGQNNQIVIGEGAIGNGTNTATIGNTTTSALHVGGNNTGIVLKAPNGTAYKITVSNAGALVVS